MMRRKKWIRNLLSFLTILCCLAGSITPVFASGTGSDVPRVTFTNEPRNSPDLYVTKTVENALEGAQYAAPEHAVFRFVLKLNGKVAGEIPYRVIDPVHGEIIRKTSGTKMDIPFQTEKKTGVFTLEAGQQAWFEGLGTGTRYEVLEEDTYLLPKLKADGTEEVDQTCELYSVVYNETGTRTDTPLSDKKVYVYDTRSLAVDGWTKKSPSGGSTGEHSILANGSSETFINRYIGKGTGTTATLTVSKSVSFPTGYQALDSTPEFPFVIELGGKPYANEAFTAVNDRTGETRSMTTDSQGRFNLQGGWTASFENVPADTTDYRVYEDTEAKRPEETTPEGDRDTDLGVDMEDSGGTRDTGMAGEIEDSGSTRSTDPAEDMEASGSTLDTDIQQEAEPGEQADASQSPENSEAVSADRTEETSAGESLLAAERSASETERVVSGVKRMAVNSSQGMLSQGTSSQGTPAQGNQTSGGVTPIFEWPEGWWPTDDTVLTGSVQSPLTELNFYNSNVSFMVTKRMEDYSTPDVDFEFRLADGNNTALGGVQYYVYNTDGSPVYDTQSGGGRDDVMAYNVTGRALSVNKLPGGTQLIRPNKVTVNGNPIRTGRTQPNGKFKLKPGQAAVFIGLPPETSYQVTETKYPGYTQVLPASIEDTQGTVPSDGQISSIDFVNRPEDMKGTLSVTKNVTYETPEGELGEDEFHFILYRRLTEDDARKLFGVDSISNIKEDMICGKLSKGEIVLTDLPQQMAGPGILSPPSSMLQSLDTEMRMTTQVLDAETQPSGTAAQSLDAETQPSGTAQQSPVRLKAKAIANAADDAASGSGTKHTDAWTCTIDGTNYAVYTPAENRNFEIPGGVDASLSCQTGPWESWLKPGEFALENGQTARFRDKVKVGDEYLVREIGLSEEYREAATDTFEDPDTGEPVEIPAYGYQRGYEWDSDAKELKQTFLARAGMVMAPMESKYGSNPGGLALTIQNTFTPKKIDLVLTKTNEKNETIADREAHFMLYRTEGGLDGPVLPDHLEDGTDPNTFVYKTVNGVLTIPNLKAGTYWLYERKAPSGYCLLPEPVVIDLKWTEGGLTVTIDGKPYRGPADTESVKSDVLGSISITQPQPIPAPEPDPDEGETGGDANASMNMQRMAVDVGGGTGSGIIKPLETNTQVNLSIRNTELYELPSTGGIGIYWYSIGGTLLMLAAALILYKYQRRGRC